MRACIPTTFSVVALAGMVFTDGAAAGVVPQFFINAIAATNQQPVHFTFYDGGTGATNYVVEFSAETGVDSQWQVQSNAVITSQGNGAFQVVAGSNSQAHGFYRLRAEGGSASVVTASFSVATVDGEEGTIASPMIVFSSPVFGTVRYVLGGTAAAGDFVTLSGEVAVNGSSAVIPITLTDNEQISQLRYLTLTLEPGSGYQLGAISQSTVNIFENDADWQGTLTLDDANVGFVLRVLGSNGVHMASVRSDGVGLLPTSEVPASILLDANHFTLAASGIPIPAADTFLDADVTLTLSLSAANGVTNQLVTGSQIEGDATLRSQVSGKAYLNTTNSGTFVLMKPITAPGTNDVNLVNLP